MRRAQRSVDWVDWVVAPLMRYSRTWDGTWENGRVGRRYANIMVFRARGFVLFVFGRSLGGAVHCTVHTQHIHLLTYIYIVQQLREKILRYFRGGWRDALHSCFSTVNGLPVLHLGADKTFKITDQKKRE